MEWSIPIQKLEVDRVYTGALQRTAKPLTPLSYKDGAFDLMHLNILMPPLVVKEYEITTGKLILSLADSAQTTSKLLALQDTLLNTVYANQKLWFGESNRTREQIHTLFQPFLESTSLHLYCPLQIQEKKHCLHIWKDNEWHRLVTPNLIKKGDVIRVGLRMQGISYQLNPQSNTWTGRFRVQHRIFCIYHCSSQKPKPLAEAPQCSSP